VPVDLWPWRLRLLLAAGGAAAAAAVLAVAWAAVLLVLLVLLLLDLRAFPVLLALVWGGLWGGLICRTFFWL
jgi:hypothetical protein